MKDHRVHINPQCHIVEGSIHEILFKILLGENTTLCHVNSVIGFVL